MSNAVPILEKKKVSKKVLVYLWILLSIILLGTTGYFYFRYQKLSQNPISAQIASQKEAERLAKDIGKLMLLPKDEIPTVATVTDIDKLKDQLFFKNAKNGNKVLIYPNSKLAIIYDPKANLIINVGPMNFSSQQTQPIQKTRIGLRNGTNVTGLTYKIETDIKKLFPEVDIVLKDRGKNTDYEKTIIVVLNDAARNAAENLAKTLNSQVDKLPEGETLPAEVDLLIIVGKDKI